MASTDEEDEDQYSQSFDRDSGDMVDDMEFEKISKIRKKDRTPAQQKTFDRINHYLKNYFTTHMSSLQHMLYNAPYSKQIIPREFK